MSKAKIMVVEDEIIVANDIKIILEMTGYSVTALVSSGEKAIQEAEISQPDLVLMDIMLKGDINGIEAAEQIRDRFQIPVIYLTAYADDDTLQRAKITEPYGYIIKPFQERELKTNIEMALYKHKAEEALKRSEMQYRTTLDSMSDAIHVVDSNLRIVLFNKALKNLSMKLDLETDVIGMDLFEIFSFLSNSVREEYNRVFKTGEMLFTEESTKIKEFEIVTETRKIPIFEDGKVARVVTVIRDITDKRKFEEEMLKIQRLESLGILAGGIAHNFNNILTAIIGNISLALMYSDPDKIREKLTAAEKAAAQAKDLTQQLLTFSKGGAPVKETASIAGLIKDSAIFTLRGTDVKCGFYISDNLWTAEIDSGQISQVVNNLIINADQAMPKGGIIEIRAENVILGPEYNLPLKDGPYIKISIADQGIGISEENLSRIFEPYFTTKNKGNGLGLATSYSIIKNHGGYITVESQVGIGTTFHIYLPASGVSLAKAEEVSYKTKAQPAIGKGRILVVDDEEYIRDLVENILSKFGYEVSVVLDGNQAISLYKEARESGEPFDVVIMDLIIPGSISGKEAIQELISIDPEVKAIVSSGYSNDPVMADFSKYGFKGVIAKPYSIYDMIEILTEVMKEKSDSYVAL